MEKQNGLTMKRDIIIHVQINEFSHSELITIIIYKRDNSIKFILLSCAD